MTYVATMAEGVITKVRAEIEHEGFVFVPRLLPDVSTAEIAVMLGVPLKLGAGSAVHVLTPKPIEEATTNSYSGNYGLEKFPLHSDFSTWFIPPRYLMLRCIVGTNEVSTTLLKSSAIVEGFGASLLTRMLVRPRRKVSGKTSILMLLQKIEDDYAFRWDFRYLQSVSKSSQSKFEELTTFISGAKVLQIQMADPGDTMVIDNWKMLHGRSAVPEFSRNREIERVYLGEIRNV